MNIGIHFATAVRIDEVFFPATDEFDHSHWSYTIVTDVKRYSIDSEPSFQEEVTIHSEHRLEFPVTRKQSYIERERDEAAADVEAEKEIA